MMRALPLIPIVILAASPLLMHPTPGFAAVAAVAGGLCAAGAFARWRPLVTGGASLTLIQYTVALIGARSSPASAIVVGVSLALMLDVSEFAGRFRGAALASPVLRRQARHFVSSALLGALLATALATLPALVRIRGPVALPPVLGTLGALAAALGVAGAVWGRQERG